MNVLVFDVETTHVYKPNGKHTPLPYFGNHLVSVGYVMTDGENITEEEYLFFYHKEAAPTPGGFEKFQSALDRADIIVGHNIKFDLNWIRECNFKYDGPVYDTMVGEYILARSRKWGLGLVDLAERYDVTRKKTDLTKDYLKGGKTFADMPEEVVEEYGRADVIATWEVARAQMDRYETTWQEFAA